MNRITAVTAALLLLSVHALGTESRKEPWRYTLDERLELRSDKQRQEERLAQHGRSVQGRAVTSPRAFVDVVDGRVHPELYLPTELFRTFVMNGFTEGSEGFRFSFKAKSDDVLITDHEWRSVEPLVADYRDTLTREHELLRAIGAQTTDKERHRLQSELKALRSEQCQLGARSLSQVRTHFTGERFDRFLYTVVAPTLTRFISEPLHDHDVLELRRIEGGCQ